MEYKVDLENVKDSKNSSTFSIPSLLLAGAVTFTANSQSIGNTLVNPKRQIFHTEVPSTKVHHELKDSWAKNKLTLVRRSAKIDNRPMPSESVMGNSEALLNALIRKNIKPKFINPSLEGGIIIEFDVDHIYHLVELYNDGDIAFLIRNPEKTQVFDLTPENYLEHIVANLDT